MKKLNIADNETGFFQETKKPAIGKPTWWPLLLLWVNAGEAIAEASGCYKRTKQFAVARWLFLILILGGPGPFSLFAQVPNQRVYNGDPTAPVTFPGTGCVYHWVNTAPGIGLAASGVGNIPSFKAVNTGASTVTATITATPVASPGYAYVPNGDATYAKTISVIDVGSNAVVATIETPGYPGNTAVSHDGTRVYFTYANSNGSGYDYGLGVINTSTNQVVNQFVANPAATFLLPSPDGTKLYAVAGAGVIAIDPTTGATIQTIEPLSGAETLALSPYGSRLYVEHALPNYSDPEGDHPGNIAIYNTATWSLVSTIPTPLPARGITISPDGSMLYASIYGDIYGNYNEVMAINLATNAVVGTIPANYPLESVFSPDGSRLYCITLGSVMIINTATNVVISTIQDAIPQGVDISTDGSKFYVIDDRGFLSVYSAATNTRITTVPVGEYPGDYGKFITGPINCDGSPLSLTITVKPGVALSSMKITPGKVSPAFASTTHSYTDQVKDVNSYVIVTPVPQDSTATVTVNGAMVTYGSPGPAVPVAVGTDTVNAVVTEPDGTVSNYSVTVLRPDPSDATLAGLFTEPYLGLEPRFSPDSTKYITGFAYQTTSVQIITATTDPGATFTVDGAAAGSGGAATVPLNVGLNTISIVVTSHNGKKTKTYTILASRAKSDNNNLIELHPTAGLMTRGFNPQITTYTDSATYQNTSVQVTPVTQDSTATVSINGVAVASGTLSQVIPLAEGSNKVTAIVTAQNGSPKTYTINMIRAGSSDASLSEMHPNAGHLNRYFTPVITSYTDTVNYTNTSVRITPVAQDSLATIMVNGTAVASGSLSQTIALPVGNTVINTVVTAPDGVTTKTFTLTVTRRGPPPGAAPDAAFRPQGYDTEISAQQLADDGILVHQAVSPNGDGINDFLQIDNIAKYPENKLVIMNNNGQLVYEATGYDNSSKVFDGHSSKNGQMQLPGTYFYELDYTVKGITKTKTGFIVLKY